jgi:putative transposase
MSKRRLNTEQIFGVLKQLEPGRTAAEMARETGVSKHTIYAWKSQYGGMEVSEVEELRSLRDENHRLKKLVADLSLDNEMLKSLIQKTDTARGLEGAARSRAWGRQAFEGELPRQRAPGLRAGPDSMIDVPIRERHTARRVAAVAAGRV